MLEYSIVNFNNDLEFKKNIMYHISSPKDLSHFLTLLRLGGRGGFHCDPPYSFFLYWSKAIQIFRFFYLKHASYFRLKAGLSYLLTDSSGILSMPYFTFTRLNQYLDLPVIEFQHFLALWTA